MKKISLGEQRVHHPKENLVRFSELLKRTGLSKTRAYELMKAGDLAKPAKIGRTSVWASSDVDDFIAKVMAGGLA